MGHIKEKRPGLLEAKKYNNMNAFANYSVYTLCSKKRDHIFDDNLH